ncbi:glyoxal oxidase [Pluteus cervinus]|uniref:Glyoxal oxidase n=1 Tax=Pluteus cervinus TaxID=181527 RepID=A0ACD3AJU3_9AGAR|nr:glyoxal oxidase [Pluteus cervinus]
MMLGNEEKVYILDKAENNDAQVNGHSAWGSVWDFNTHQSQVMDIRTNTFCSSGMHLPNGSFVTFGGQIGIWDSEYQDFDGGLSIRVLNPCRSSDNFASPECQWYDDPSVLSMQRRRWYSSAEPTGDGDIILIGGFVNGGYINRQLPNLDPENGGAECSYEFFPANGRPATRMDFLVRTSGLNAYAHAFQMPSGRMFVQANLSTILWDYNQNVETPLPDMPNGVVRVYPASGAVAMLPLTPANNWEPTILFCGGSDMPDAAWGDYSNPGINTWNYPASQDCQRITPEPQDGSAPVYVQDDNLMNGRTMGQFVLLPDGKVFLVNGGLNGTAGYADATGETTGPNQMPFGQSLASGPVLTPVIYDPNAPQGQRWSNTGLGSAQFPRLYHSSAMLLPDASVLIAGSNPSADVNKTTFFPTTYEAEIFYPPYFSAKVRPTVQGVPQTISYGGSPFDLTIPNTGYTGNGNDAADSAQVVLHRGGFTTHAMNMGQRHLQLNNTYTVNDDGSIVLHVSQAPPNSNIFQPGPAFLFVVIHGIPSNGTHLIVGSGQVGPQPINAVADLPSSVKSASATGSGDKVAPSGTSKVDQQSNGNHTTLIAAVAGAVVVICALAAGGFWFLSRRHAATKRGYMADTTYPMTGYGGPVAGYDMGTRHSNSSAFVPLHQSNYSDAWNGSTTSLNAPYRDEWNDGRSSGMGVSMDYDPYTTRPMSAQGQGPSSLSTYAQAPRR